MFFNKKWKHVITCTEQDAKLFGVNIFEYEWKATGEKVEVKDPLYNNVKQFCVFTVDVEGKVKRFAAGEFGNCVWGFYIEK